MEASAVGEELIEVFAGPLTEVEKWIALRKPGGDGGSQGYAGLFFAGIRRLAD